MSHYFELQKSLDEALDAFDNESNSDTRNQIQGVINALRSEMDNYPLADDDLFRCSSCNKVTDIENSLEDHQGELHCCFCSSGFEVSFHEDAGDRNHGKFLCVASCEDGAESIIKTLYPNAVVRHIEKIDNDDYRQQSTL